MSQSVWLPGGEHTSKYTKFRTRLTSVCLFPFDSALLTNTPRTHLLRDSQNTPLITDRACPLSLNAAKPFYTLPLDANLTTLWQGGEHGHSRGKKRREESTPTTDKLSYCNGFAALVRKMPDISESD
eukprot:g59028.t1